MRPLFLLCSVEILGFGFGVLYCGIAGLGGLSTPGPAPPPHHFALEVFNVGSLLTHGDLAFQAGVDFSLLLNIG